MTGTRATLGAVCAAIWREALQRLQAARLVSEALAARPLPPGPVRVLALGKAAGPMMEAALAALGARARDPLCVLPEGAPAPAGVTAIAAGHPRPTPGSLAAGRAILGWAAANAGASALAFAPADGLSAADKADAVAAVMRAGATIQRLNAVRKHLSALKGGRLAPRPAPPHA